MQPEPPCHPRKGDSHKEGPGTQKQQLQTLHMAQGPKKQRDVIDEFRHAGPPVPVLEMVCCQQSNCRIILKG
jgi:hypothetical protein